MSNRQIFGILFAIRELLVLCRVPPSHPYFIRFWALFDILNSLIDDLRE